ncbi:MAG TPA: hypothetical protein VM582_08855, partial [Candidatus Thermoplasmatota archaeon]|nr:hypothetical protein [Candidatus Thermoplasmatota archaeon]
PTPTLTTPPATPTSTARFQVTQLVILRPDGTAGELHEDDGGAIVRYTIREADDAPRAETAFVSYLLNGRIVDIQQLKLEPGQERTFERKIGDLRDNRTIRVEVRAASSSMKAEAQVLDWPRAGRDSLTLGPLRIRADYGFMEQDGRVLVNFTLTNNGPEQELRDFRAKMLCVSPNGTVRQTNSVRIEPPTAGNSTGVDVLLDDCSGDDMRYGVEFKGRGADGDLVGRLLLVERGWRPAAP